ncbi:hypothetical protein V1264_011616 [Littorina saxatilis]|uniref:MICAL-like protein 2 n=1 Tax=Littorina saxatilis TaxID=31220 RepID=A0AAN9BVD5_9CAEN
MATKIKGLQQWCKRMTDGYHDVNVTDFTKSWRDGLAFCAMIHRFRPDLIDFDSLSKENVYENNHLAFTVAEQELDIPAFLEAADMVALKTPDKLSVITYVSQYYNKLGSLPQLGGPGVREKTAPAASAGTKRHQKAEPLSEPEPKKQPPARNVGGDSKTKGKSLGDKCGICNNKVYLLERHIEDGKLFHRSCYRHSDLSPTNKVYTRSPFMSPSLHSKDGGSTPTSKSPQTFFPSDKGAGVGKTSAGEEKHGVKRPSDDAKCDEKSKKSGSGIQKMLFSDKSKDTGSDVSKDRPGLSNLKIPVKSETSNTAQADKILSPTPKFDARSLEKHSLDFLAPEKDVKDVKSPKRQLPLIFQAAEKDDTSGAKDKTKKGPDMKTSLFSKDKAGSSQSSVLSGNKGENSKSFLSGIKAGGDSKSSVLPRSRLDIAKSVSDTEESEKSSGPVAKPRQIVKKVVEEKMDTSEPVQIRSKSPFPKAAPRSSLAQAEPSQKPTSSLPSSPPALRKARTKSPARDLSPEHSAPPPLPSSAPPPLPLSVPPSASPHPSPRHLPSATSHSKETTKSSEALLPKKSESSSKTPRQKSASASVSSMVLSSASNKASASGGKDSAPHLPSRPPPKLSVVSSEASSSNSSAVSPSPPPPPSVLISSKTTSSSATSVPSALSSKSTSSSSKDTSTTFTSKSTISIPSNKVREEPMDVDIAFNKARSQYGEEPVAVMVVPVDKDKKEKTALSGLLSSLAKVRSAPSSSTTTSTTTTSSSSALGADKTHSNSSALSSDSKSASNTTEKNQNRFSVPSSSDFKSATSNVDKSQSRFSVPTSESKSTSSKTSSGFVSSKVDRLETKDSDHKSSLEFALSGKDKSDRVSPRDIQISNSEGKSSLATQKHGNVLISKSKDSQSKVSPRFQDISADTKLPDKKLSEPVTVTLNLGNKAKEEPSKPKSTIFSNLKLNGKHAEQNGKPVDDTPQWKKNLADSRVNSANKSQAEPMDTTSSLSADFPGRRDRAKSAAGVLATKILPSSKQSAATADSLQPPPFMQVKLRDSGNSTVDRKERSKSAGNVFENSVSGESKPTWQLEAERRMAAFRDTGFVDPEFKKSTSGSESPEEEEDDTVMRKDKEEPVALVVPQRRIAGFSPRGEENLQARMKEEAKKSDGKLEQAGKESKPEVKASVSKQPAAAEKDKSAADKDSSKPAKKGLNLNLRSILKSEEKNRPAPAKPERHIPPATKQQEPEIKVAPATPRASDKPSDPSLRASPKETEDTAAKKKIAVGKDAHTTSPPPRPSTPPRKKVSVDINFDFNASNSLEVSEKPKERPPPPKLTPPARPPPPRTSMSPGRISAIELQHQLLDIDSKLSELELRGRHLEDSIRSAVVEEEDDLMVEWFQLVTDKNDLVRKETDLVYMSREQELEDEQSQIESQLRYLLTLEDNDKSFEEKQEEGYLIDRKLDIVNQRNSIVDSMDEDRLRYEEEDRDIAQVLQEKGYRRDSTSSSPVKSPEKGGKKKDKKGKD